LPPIHLSQKSANVKHHGAFDIIHRNVTYGPAVHAVVSVVAQDKDMPFRHLITFLLVVNKLFCQIRLIQKFTVSLNALSANLYYIPRQAYNPFYQQIPVFHPVEYAQVFYIVPQGSFSVDAAVDNHYIPVFPSLIKGFPYTGEYDIIIIMQGRLHGFAFHTDRLKEE